MCVILVFSFFLPAVCGWIFDCIPPLLWWQGAGGRRKKRLDLETWLVSIPIDFFHSVMSLDSFLPSFIYFDILDIFMIFFWFSELLSWLVKTSFVFWQFLLCIFIPGLISPFKAVWKALPSEISRGYKGSQFRYSLNS